MESDAAPKGGLMQVGLLLETVQRQQHQIEGLLQRLELWSGDLDGVVRESVRHTLVEELQAAAQAARQAGDALQSVHRHVRLRIGIWGLCLMVACTATPVALAWALVPRPARIAQLRQQYDDMAARLERLKEEGGGIDVRRCGTAPRLCVRVDRKAPAYGDAADYLVIKGY